MLKSFDELLAEEIAAQDGAVDTMLAQAPALYRLLTHLLGDPALPARLRPLLLAGIAYFVLPEDILSEDLRGLAGFADDVFLAAWIANRVLQETASERLLTDNWDGDAPLLSLLSEILAREGELVGEHFDLILWFIGYEYLA